MPSTSATYSTKNQQQPQDGISGAIWAKIRSVRRRASLPRRGDKENAAPAQIVPGENVKHSSGEKKQASSRTSKTSTRSTSERRPLEQERSHKPASIHSAQKGSTARANLRSTEVSFKGKTVAFQAPSTLSFLRGVGSGAYGVVAAFKDNRTAGKNVAVKFVRNAFHDLFDGQRILREIRLLRCLSHDNIVSLRGLYSTGDRDCQDIYIMTDLMDTDLGKIIKSSEVLTEEHNRWFGYQILRALLYIHSAGVVHRDLKPSNVLVNKDCTVKLCDFGLARSVVGSQTPGTSSQQKLTEYVVTRYYRAPEVILLSSDYGAPIDIWAAGCTIAELIARKPLFKGKDPVDQIREIFKVLGTPAGNDLAWLSHNSSAVSFCRRFAGQPGQPLNTLLPKASQKALSAVKTMLIFDPHRRPAAAGCMRLPFFEGTYQKTDEKQVASGFLDWSFDIPNPTLRSLQALVRSESSALSKELGTPVIEDGATLITFP
eukprot:gb/GFBE01079886.1/.p1 GENE.gb/GFBE01079886.1/~~gb/GFBE01079886.1/.p1  ORF type:complete len:486 (+),score=95.39 gb/GFBE01079886.1/:1-1458(+)